MEYSGLINILKKSNLKLEAVALNIVIVSFSQLHLRFLEAESFNSF